MGLFSYFFSKNGLPACFDESDDESVIVCCSEETKADKKYILQLQIELSDLRLQLIAEGKSYTKQLNEASEIVDQMRCDLNTTKIIYNSLKCKYDDLLIKYKSLINIHNNKK